MMNIFETSSLDVYLIWCFSASASEAYFKNVSFLHCLQAHYKNCSF